MLQILDIAVQSDIRILKECPTFRNIWVKFLSADGNIDAIENSLNRTNTMKTDECMMETLIKFDSFLSILSSCDDENTSRVLSLFFKTSLKSLMRRQVFRTLELPCESSLKDLVLGKVLFHIHLRSPALSRQENEDIYQLRRFAHSDPFSFNISTCRLRYAISLLMKGDYLSTLSTVNDVLSRMPPYALYYSAVRQKSVSSDVKQLYLDMCMSSNISTSEKARTAWLFDLMINKDAPNMPLAIQIEQHFCEPPLEVLISPFTCAYYLMFLCYHELNQYNSRNRSLRQLVDVATNVHKERGLAPYPSYNIAGHCLLLAGAPIEAREMFVRSCLSTRDNPVINRYNSARYYLQHAFDA